MNILSQKILNLRKNANLTQEQLASELGVTPQSVSNWERGGAPDISMLPVIANFFSVTIDELMGNDPKNVKEQKLSFWYELSKLTNPEEKLNRLLDEYRKYPHDFQIMHHLIYTLPRDRKENIVFIEALCEKLLAEAQDPDLRERAISLMAHISDKEDREKWIERLSKRTSCRAQAVRKSCLAQDGDNYGAAKQCDLLTVIQIDEFCDNWIPDGIGAAEKGIRIRRHISVIEAICMTGEVPDAWVSVYAYKLLVLSACLFGEGAEENHDEAWQCFEDSIAYFEKWFAFPDSKLLATGIGGICLEKSRHFAFYPDGTREVIGSCMGRLGRITPEYLLTNCLFNKTDWAWFNLARTDARFISAVKRIEAYASK